MDLVSRCPFVASTVVWQAGSGAFALTVVVKATFVLHPGTAQLAPEQDPIFAHDRFHDDDPRRSVRFPSDVVPYKPRADVLLVGHAYAPDKQPVRSLVTRFVVGEMDKSIEVFCDRAFRVVDGQLLEAKRFTQMPLVWERASGGPESANPVGKRFDGPVDTYGTVAIANLQPLGHFVSKRSDTFVPTCYAPIASTWPGRVQRLGPMSRTLMDGAWHEKPLPRDLDPSFFQAAPPDQNVAEIRANERIVLENLHPDHARLVTTLPDLRPRAIANRATGEQEDIGLVADTLIVDSDRGVCCVVWRGRIGLRTADEAGVISVTMEGQAGGDEVHDDLQVTMPPQRAEEQPAEDLAAMTLIGAFVSKASAPVMPFAGGDKQTSGSEAIRNVAGAGLPFGGAAPTPGLPFASKPVAPPPTPPPGLVPPAPAPAIVPPAYVPPAVVVAPPQATAASVWASGAPPVAPAVVPRETIGEAAAAAAAAASVLPVPNVDRAAQDGALGMSNHAANKSEWRAPTADGASSPVPATPAPLVRPGSRLADPREALSLLWFDATSVRRLRNHKPFRQVLEEAEQKPVEPGLDDLSTDELTADVEDRRDVFEILAHALSTDAPGVIEALDRSIRADGKVIPQLVLCAGELVMPFDEVERLKATVATVTPLSVGDENLKASLQIAKDYLALPNLSSAPAVADGLVKRILESFGLAKRAVTVDYVEMHTERALLEQRHYQRRKVFGGKHLRCLLVPGGSKEPIPTYLPEALADELPMYAHFRVRLIAEVRMAEDQYETHAAALRVLGLGRVVERKR